MVVPPPGLSTLELGFIMKNLTVFSLVANDHLVQPEEFEDVNGGTSALSILTDFRSHKAHMVDADIEASEALELMLAEDVRTKIVVNKEREFIGVISLDDLSEHNMVLKRISLRVRPEELLVRDLMHSRRDIRAIDYAEFSRAKVADVVSTLKKQHQDYLLVVDQDEHHIRGLVSARDISRRLHTPVEIERELTFVDIFTAVRAH